MEAPTPLKPETKEINKREEEKYSITKDGETYILTLSTTNNDSILFNMKLDKELIHSYYEVERNYKDLIDLSKQFFAAESLSDSWEFLIANINKYQKDILFDINDNKLELSLKFDYLRNKARIGKISLMKKTYELKDVLVKLEKKFSLIQNNQTNIEKKLDEKLSSIVSEQNDIKNTLKEKIKDFNTINLSNKQLENIVNQNQDLIKDIEETQISFKNKFENLTEKNKAIQSENENKFKELKNYIYKNIEKNLFNSIEQKLDSIKENHGRLKNIINENNEKFSIINKKISNCKDSTEKISEDIKTLEEKHKTMKSNFNDNVLKINSLELNQENLAKKVQNNSLSINESLKKALKDIEFLKNKIKDNEIDIKAFRERINNLENEKSKFSVKEEKKPEYTKISVKPNSKLTYKREYDRNTLNTPRDSQPTHYKNYSLLTEPSPYSKYYNYSKEEESNLSNKEKFERTLERNFTETNFFKRPHKFTFYKNIGTNLFTRNCYNNRACIFNYYKDQNYIVYGVKTLDLMCYDCSKESSILSNPFKLFSNFHKNFFDSVRHFYDYKNFRDLIITASLDSHVKVVDFKRKESKLIYDFDFEYLDNVIINTAYFIENKIMIPFSFHKGGNYISFYSLTGIKIDKLIGDPGFILHLNTYYSSYSKLNYVIVSNTEGVYVYNINNYSLYNKFLPKNTLNKKNPFAEAHIIEKDEKEILIGPNFSLGCLYLWNLRTKNLVSLIQLTNGITDICLWNNNYIFVSFVNAEKDKFILLNLDSKEVEKKFDDIKDNICYGIKILKHKTGDLLMTFTSAGKLYLYKL